MLRQHCSFHGSNNVTRKTNMPGFFFFFFSRLAPSRYCNARHLAYLPQSSFCTKCCIDSPLSINISSSYKLVVSLPQNAIQVWTLKVNNVWFPYLGCSIACFNWKDNDTICPGKAKWMSGKRQNAKQFYALEDRWHHCARTHVLWPASLQKNHLLHLSRQNWKVFSQEMSLVNKMHHGTSPGEVWKQ